MKVTTVLGARPQFVKAAAVSRAMHAVPEFHERIVHTGQHYDRAMSDVFFAELEIPKPASSLGIGGGTHGQNTGRMIEAVEADLIADRPDVVVVYGDTDSTIAGSLAASKLHIPVAHVEAGLRSFNRAMPEETNRVVTDHVADLLFAPTAVAVQHLVREGIPPSRIEHVGDVMFDAMRLFAPLSRTRSTVLETVGVAVNAYVLATIHRPANVDEPNTLRSIIDALGAAPFPVVWPIHPRTRGRIASAGIPMPTNVRAIEPVGFLDMVRLESSAALIVTDSGGVQKEAFFCGVPCITVRSETEWTELVDLGVNRLAPTGPELSIALRGDLPTFPTVSERPYGEGDAAQRIVQSLGERYAPRT